MLNSELTATTLGVDQEDDNVYDSLPISGTCQDVVTVHSMLDEEIDRASYDADLYDGHNDGAYMHLTNDQEQPSTINSLSTCDIQQIIEDITHRNTTVKSFTKADLNAHISSHWTFQIQVDSGASDCITPDKHILKHYFPWN